MDEGDSARERRQVIPEAGQKVKGCPDIRVGDRRPSIEKLNGWQKHSSPKPYGQALTATDAKDAREGQ
jgi:hypothetical protein